MFRAVAAVRYGAECLCTMPARADNAMNGILMMESAWTSNL